MKEELDGALCRDFPRLFRDRHASIQVTCMCWGFSCEDGWEPLIRECAAKIEAINNRIENPDQYIIAIQVKEKYGTLRFYVGSYPTEHGTEIDEAINMAETKSEVTCEVCGNPGKTVGVGWLRTVCEDHKRRDDE